MKIRLVKDNIHSNIVMSDIEYKLMTKIFMNRLRDISQMGQVKFVYPSATHSRFIHSIGTMHVAGMYFKNAVANTSIDVLINFLEDSFKQMFDQTLNKLKNDRNDLVGTKEQIENLCKMLKLIDEYLGKEFVNHYSVNLNGVLKVEHKYGECKISHQKIYYILLEILRIYAMYHDIGHVAMSHLLEQVYQEEIRRMYTKKHVNLHELLTLELLKYVSVNIDKDEFSTNEIAFLSKISIPIVIDIIKSNAKNKSTNICCKYFKNIIDNDIDVDKLDYIARDGFNTGVLNIYSDIERVILTPQIVKKGKSKNYLIVPTTRASKNIENVLKSRSIIYHAIIGHHKSRKYEAYFRIAISNLIRFVYIHKEELKQNRNQISVAPQLSDLYHKIIQLVENHPLIQFMDLIKQSNNKFKNNKNVYIDKDAIIYMIQLTDSSLESLLRVIYQLINQAINKKDEIFNVYNLDPLLLMMYIVLSEIYEGKKQYIPIWKNYSSYIHLLEKYVHTKKPNLTIDQIHSILNSLYVYDKHECYQKYLIQKKIPSSRITIYSFIRRSLSNHNMVSLLTKKQIYPFIIAINNFKSTSGNTEIYDSHSSRLVKLENISSYFKAETLESQYSPPIYIYIYKTLYSNNSKKLTNYTFDILTAIIDVLIELSTNKRIACPRLL